MLIVSYFDQASICGLVFGIVCIALYSLIRSIVCIKSFAGFLDGVEIELVFVVERADRARIESSYSFGIVLISRRLSLDFD